MAVSANKNIGAFQTAKVIGAWQGTEGGTSITAALATRTRTTHAATISRAYNITANLATRTRTTHAATITATQAELPVPDAQPGGWIPRTIYVDDDGNPVDLDEIREAVEEAVEEALEAEQPKQAKAVRRSADRVLARLSAAQTASQKDIQRLRAAIAQSEAALAALDRAIEAQEDEDAAVALLLAH